MKGRKFGTRQSAPKTINCAAGCSHDCLYCYAKSMAVRFHQIPVGQWANEAVRPQAVIKKHPNYGDVVMFPSSHDITPGQFIRMPGRTGETPQVGQRGSDRLQAALGLHQGAL